MSNHKPAKTLLDNARAIPSNRMRKADARIAYRNAYPKGKCKWMGSGWLPPAKSASGRAYK